MGGSGIDSTLTQFALTGRLGALSLGITPTEARGLLGEPEDVSTRRPAVWKYGQLEIAFTPESGAVQINVYVWKSDLALPRDLGVAPEFDATSTVTDVLTALSARGVVVETVPVMTNGDQLTFSVRPSGVHFFFVRERLHALGIFG